MVHGHRITLGTLAQGNSLSDVYRGTSSKCVTHPEIPSVISTLNMISREYGLFHLPDRFLFHFVAVYVVFVIPDRLVSSYSHPLKSFRYYIA